MRARKLYTSLALLAGLAACGETTGEQALYGAGAGLLGSYLVDGNPLLGAAAGAGGNYLYCQTNPDKCG